MRLEAIDLGAEVAASREAVAAQSARQATSRTRKSVAVRIVGDDERGVLGAEEIRAAGARHARHREVGRQPGGSAAFVSRHRAEAGMEADERPAADRNARRRTGHHVVVAGAVVALVVADRADDGQLVACRRERLHMLGEEDAGHLGGDGSNSPRISLGASGLGSKVS